MDKAKSKTALAKELGISRSSLYYHQKKPERDEEFKEKILEVMSEHPAYGHKRIAMALGRNKKAVRRVMKIYGLKPQKRRGWRHTKPDDLNRPETRVENVLKILCPARPSVVWAGDFTYLWFEDKFWYLATIIDVYTREIVGWHIGNHHTTSLILEAFQDAVRRTQTAPTYFHSDQGSEYVSGAYESLLAAHSTVPSHSRKSSPWQNGFQESFYSQFKLELGDIRQFQHIGQLIEAIHRQIHYYNTKRIHTALKMPPLMFRNKQIRKDVAVATSLQTVIYSTI